MFLVVVSVVALVAIIIHGLSYYVTPIHLRPFRADYEQMKTSGNYSHGLGIIGASMIIIGVTTYSTRKRVRALWRLGKLPVWLEFHIFLCLLGPVLVIFHTTFKAGGVAAISLWTMLSVAASGIIGRFLYVQIPRNIQGGELSEGQVKAELDRLGAVLASSPLGSQLARTIDQSFSGIPRPKSLAQTFSSFFRLQSTRRHVRKMLDALIATSTLSREQARQVHETAAARASLVQKSLIFSQAGKLFHYWHAIHLPFTIIMFLTLAAHVVVSILLGYTWIF